MRVNVDVLLEVVLMFFGAPFGAKDQVHKVHAMQIFSCSQTVKTINF